jgi:gluconolactonase
VSFAVQSRRLIPSLLVETDAHEGPVYAADENALYFTTFRRETVAIKRVDLTDMSLSMVRSEANTANGMTLDREGRLVICEQGTMTEPARITRLDRSTGAIETLVDSWNGRALNSPNDVVVRSDGTVWFTDPSYGYLQAFRPPPQLGDHVYRFDPSTGSLEVAAHGFDKPNGLAFSPDESVLYVGDNGAPKELLAFNLQDGGRLQARRTLAVSAGDHPDGLKVAGDGQIYTSSPGGVEIFASTGELIGRVDLPGAVNFTFGAGERLLYITADTGIWAAELNAKGV